MSMDGSQSTILIGAPFIAFANGLSYDYTTQTLFWIDSGKDVIGSIRADGTMPMIYVDLTKLFTNAHGFSLAMYRGKVYFSDWKYDGIRVVILSNTTGADLKQYTRDPTTIRVLEDEQQPERPGGSEL